MIYLASPYSDPDPHVREARFRKVCAVASKLMRDGKHIFCPIAHTHPIALYGLPKDWDFWEAYDREYLEFCTEMIVVTLPGWKESTGVQAEIKIMQELGKPIRYAN